MERRSLKEFSFGYRVPVGGQRRAKDGANELRKIDLVEVGPTLKGMNPATELHAVKSALAASNAARLSLAALRKRSDDLALEVLTDGIELPDPSRRHVPTTAELREQAIAIGGIPVPNTCRERVRNKTRTEFMHLLSSVS